MGKSDTIIFQEYKQLTKDLSPKSVCFLGFNGENEFTRTFVNTTIRDFYDLSLNNWNINDDWTLNKKYDLIICTRCPYFSKQPSIFIEKVKNSLNENGHALIDWGLGDHWRFKNYKVGWVRNNEHEFAYRNDNFLYSCLWKDEFVHNDEVKLFISHLKNRFDYSENFDLNQIIKDEVPSIVDYSFKKIKFKFLWPDSPQLYIITLL